jgi:hypothetical protein
MPTPWFDIPYSLTEDQKSSFEHDGFLMLPDVFTPQQVHDLQSWTVEVKSWPSRPGQHMPYEEVRVDGSTGLCSNEST